VEPRRVVHEFHSLSLATLDVERPGGATVWKPLAPGLALKPLTDAPVPSRSAALRLAQMKELGRGFAATAVNFQGKEWILRRLPQPLYRYQSTDPEVIDGAVFAFVTSAGTDPELILVLEARKGEGPANPTWQFASVRFTNMALTLKLHDLEVFEAPLLRREDRRDSLNRYHATTDRTIPAVEEIDYPTTKALESRPKP
jgi:hypothetical protein